MGESLNLNHTQLIEAVALEAGLSQAVVRAVLRAGFDVIGRTVTNGSRVTVTNFGTWYAKSNPPRTVRNPQTGASRTAPASARAAFRWSPTVRDAVRSGRVLDTLKKRGHH